MGVDSQLSPVGERQNEKNLSEAEMETMTLTGGLDMQPSHVGGKTQREESVPWEGIEPTFLSGGGGGFDPQASLVQKRQNANQKKEKANKLCPGKGVNPRLSEGAGLCTIKNGNFVKETDTSGCIVE